VTLAASQLILPPESFPLSGYKIAEDRGTDTYWRRDFDPLAAVGADYAYMLIELTLYPSAKEAQSALPKCGATKERGGMIADRPPLSAAVVTAPTSGDMSIACAFAFAGGLSRFDYSIASRNVYVFVQVAPSLSVSQTTALDEAVAIGRVQLAIVDRIAPPFAEALATPLPPAPSAPPPPPVPVSTPRLATATPAPTSVATSAAVLQIHGVITDRASGQPISGVCVRLLATNATNPYHPDTGCFTSTNAQGSYVIDLTGRAPAGEWWALQFSKVGYATFLGGLFGLGGDPSQCPSFAQPCPPIAEKNYALNIAVPATPTPIAVGFSRQSPIVAGVPLRLTWTSVGKTYNFAITVKQTVRGATANQQVKAANQFNPAPQPAAEYLLALVRFEYVTAPSLDISYRTSSFDFDVISAQGLQYNHPTCVPPAPAYGATLYQGATAEGWICFMVQQADSQPTLVFGRSADGTGGAWWRLGW